MNFKCAISSTIFFSACMLTFSANASINNISFTGKWLVRPSQTTPDQYKNNACKIPVFVYESGGSENKDALVETAYKSQYKGGNCTFVPGTPSYGTPVTFPKGYSYNEYLRLNPSTPRSEPYFYVCDIVINNTLHTINFVIEPIYECLSEGCYSQKEQCTADIIGRDLDIPTLGSLGHTGLTTENSVLEVLKEDEVIQLNSLSDFKSKTKYWGRAYGLGKPGEVELSLDEANAVIMAGWDQTAYSPQYTLFPEYTEGQISYTNGAPELLNGIFRCDTFVQFAYKKALDIDILPEEFYHLPLHQFSEIPYKRATLSAQEQQSEPRTSGLYQNLTNILKSSSPPEEKSRAILQLNQYEKSSDEALLIYDALRFSPSRENISFLLDKYELAKATDEKLMILSALISSYRETKKDGLATDQLKRIQSVYQKILAKQEDPRLYQRAIEDLPTVYERKTAATLLRTHGPDMQLDAKRSLKRAYFNTYFLTAGNDVSSEDLEGIISLMDGCELEDQLKFISSLVKMNELPDFAIDLIKKAQGEKKHLPNCIHSMALKT